MVKQTAGRDQFGTFAPKFSLLNDDILFGEVWNREEKLSLRDRSLVTVISQEGEPFGLKRNSKQLQKN